MEISPARTAQIINRLAETADRNKVIEEVCLADGLHWQVAEQVVDQLARTHHFDLTRRLSPILVLAAFSLFLGGVFLMAWNLLGVLNYLWPYFDPKTPDAVGLYFFYSDLFQTLLFYPQAIPLFITGLAMLVGSYFGMKEVWASFFDFLEQRRKFSWSTLTHWKPAFAEPAEPQAQPEAFPAEPDFLPTEEHLAYLLKRLPAEQDEFELAEELWLKFGVARSNGIRLVHQVLVARGLEVSPRLPVTFLLLALSATFTGLIWVLQYLLLVSAYLAAYPRQIQNQWDLILRLGDLAACVEQSPALFGWFALGLICLAGGLFGLKELWPALFLLKRHPS